MNRRAAWILAGTLLCAGLAQIVLVPRQGLWADEIFSLAIATGHSLEHPAREAEPERGDFVEPERAVPAEELRRYLRHDDPAAGPARVVRAVFLSDTSPPLYYLLLWAWTRVSGTSDWALRIFSVLFALGCLPLVAWIARWAGGSRAVLPALVVSALSPLSIYYSTEGRMYSLLWFWILLFAWLSLELRARGPRPFFFLAWIAAASAGFLTHYFFAFVWAAALLFCALRPARLGRGPIVLGVLLTIATILPWYARVPASLARWRITQAWLTWEPAGFGRLAAAGRLFLSFFAGAEPNLWGENRPACLATLALCALLGVALLARRRGRAFLGRRLLLWLWLGAAWAGPLVFDALRGTYSVAVPRYALAGLPAAALLVGCALGCLRSRLRTLALAALVLSWVPNLWLLYRKDTRSWCPLREVALSVSRKAGPGDLILVHSIPSGVLGIARYAEGRSPIAAWIGQLGRRSVPGSIAALTAGHERVHLIRIHEVGEAAPEEDWLRANGSLVREQRRESSQILQFQPETSERF